MKLRVTILHIICATRLPVIQLIMEVSVRSSSSQKYQTKQKSPKFVE